jgi:DNA-binding winged helix-turn-helix (wHTH) protein
MAAQMTGIGWVPMPFRAFPQVASVSQLEFVSTRRYEDAFSPRRDRISVKRFGCFALDTANECLWREGAKIALQPRPFAVLRYLVEHPGRLITHDELLDALWPETYVQPQVLRTYMLELRKVLGDDAGQPRYIQTMPKRGYLFVAPVTEAAAQPAPAVAATSFSGHVAGEPGVQGAPLPGLDEEMARLANELSRAVGGERRVIFLSGEAGIGKSALLDAFEQHAAKEAAIARGQCVAGFEREDCYPVMEALSRLCASPDGEAACRILSRMAPEWLAPSLSSARSGPENGAVRERMPGALCAALEELASVRPLILIFEDLQWADGATLNLISALARRRAPARLMIAGTYRPRSQSAQLRQLRQDLLLQRACVEIVLGPMSRTAMLALLARELGQDAVPPRLAAFVYERAEGNPLFALAILNHLIAEKLLLKRASGWELARGFDERDAGVPDELARMVELEIERLSAEEQHLLEAGSLMSIAFPAWAVAAALGQDAADVEEACEKLARSVHFLQCAGCDELPDGSRSAFFAFTHGLYREALYRRQAAAQRSRRHIRIAERLGELFAGREALVAREMALHYEAAGNWRLGVNALRSAARYAEERDAHAEAVDLLERALRIAENSSEAQDRSAAAALRDELARLNEAVPRRHEAGQKLLKV